MQGTGGKFSPDPHTGTGKFTVPITLPPGRNGFQPQLQLVYSTGNGNGLFGLGWSLSIPGISRQTSKGIPRYNDAQDIFILSRAEDLVPASSRPEGVTRSEEDRLRENGKQYVVIAAGGNGRMGTKLGDYVVAFALPD